MRVVLIDASALGSGDAFVPAIVDTLRADPVIDRIVHVSWPLGPTGTLPAVGDGSRAAEIEKLADQMHLADAVVTVPWTIGTPSTLLEQHWAARVVDLCEAVAVAGVPAFVFGSSSLGYSPALPGVPVDEWWPMAGLPSSPLSKALARSDETVRQFQQDHPVVRVVLLRPCAIVDLTNPPPSWMFRHGKMGRLARRRRDGEMQLADVQDVADAYRLALTRSVSGPFNLAREPAPVSGATNRSALAMVTALFKPPPGRAWMHLATQSPVADTTRARRDLGWVPRARAFGERGRGSAGGRADELANAPLPAAEGGRVQSLYRQALDYFGACVSVIPAQGWQEPAPLETQVVEVVAAAARDQYRLALITGGASVDEAARMVPRDPLGIDRADGWALAHQQGELALAGGTARPGGLGQEVGDVLAAVNGLVVRGWSVSQALEAPPPLPPDLGQFMAEQWFASSGLGWLTGDPEADKQFARWLEQSSLAARSIGGTSSAS